MQQLIKVNDGAEKWVVEAFARQGRTYTGKEVVEKKGTTGKCNRIQFEMANQKNNPCSNIKNVLQVRRRCVCLCLQRGI